MVFLLLGTQRFQLLGLISVRSTQLVSLTLCGCQRFAQRHYLGVEARVLLLHGVEFRSGMFLLCARIGLRAIKLGLRIFSRLDHRFHSASHNRRGHRTPTR